MNHETLFVEHRPVLLAAAYRITGSRHDAQDVVQDAWLPWTGVDVASVRAPRTFLLVMVTRLALNAARGQRRRREEYVGPWLPEPVVDDGSPEWAVLHAEGLGLALDFVLSTLPPEQATAYVLRRVLDVDYPTIAEVVETSVVAARQLVSRAGRAVRSAVGDAVPEQPSRDAAALGRLTAAVLSGDVAQVAALLAPDATLYSDGGGHAHAALRPVQGRDKVARFLLGAASRPGSVVSPALVNGSAGILVHENGTLTTAAGLRAGADGVVGLYFVRNPDKLTALAAQGVPH